MPAQSGAYKIRVLRVQSRICIGGPALNTILLSTQLDPQRYHTLLVGGRLEPGEKTMTPFALEKGADIRIVEEMSRGLGPLNDLKALFQMIRLIRAFKPHIVHTHTAKAGAIGRVAAFLCRTPIRIHTFHGHTFHGYFSPWASWLVVWSERLLTRLSHRIVVISRTQKEDICQRYRVAPEFKTSIVPLGFELDKVRLGRVGAFRQRLGLAKGTILVAILARLVPIKNHQLLLHAIAFWRKLVPQVQPSQVSFLVVGDGELRGSLELLADELGIKPFVIFTGWLQETADIYADINLNVLVSKNEGTPVTLIEGLANGVPILTTDVGGISDFADEHCGTILAADITAQQLAHELARVLTIPGGPPRLAEEIVGHIRSRFDVTRLVADMDRLYCKETRRSRICDQDEPSNYTL